MKRVIYIFVGIAFLICGYCVMMAMHGGMLSAILFIIGGLLVTYNIEMIGGSSGSTTEPYKPHIMEPESYCSIYGVDYKTGQMMAAKENQKEYSKAIYEQQKAMLKVMAENSKKEEK